MCGKEGSGTSVKVGHKEGNLPQPIGWWWCSAQPPTAPTRLLLVQGVVCAAPDLGKRQRAVVLHKLQFVSSDVEEWNVKMFLMQR